MSKREELRTALRWQPSNATFSQLEKTLLRFGFHFVRVKGTHHLFLYQHTEVRLIMIVPVHEPLIKLPIVRATILMLDKWFPANEEAQTAPGAPPSTMPPMKPLLDSYLSLPYMLDILPDNQQGGWVARVKDLPGCHTQSQTREALPRLINEAKAGWLEAALEFGHPIPEPTARAPAPELEPQSEL